MNLSLKGFAQLVQDMSAALQSSATKLVDVSVGSVIRALLEANASVVLWLQWLILQVLQTTRASTSIGPDLDSWMMDFGLIRLPATASMGTVTFSRLAANITATIPVGTIVKTSDGGLSFSVAEDHTVSTWTPTSSAYVIPQGVTSVDLPISCTVGGSQGNVLAGMITIIATSLPAVDQVTNPAALTNGANAEDDQAFRSRFQSFLATRSRATLGAVRNAIASVQQNLDALILENTGLDGTPQSGAFLIVLDDGSGQPPTALLSNVSTAVEAVRPIGTTFAVVPPTITTVDISMVVRFYSTNTSVSDVQAIQNQIAAYLNTLPVGKCASVTRVAQQAYLAATTIENVTGVQLNGGIVDVNPPPLGVIKAGQISVAPSDG